MTCRSLLCTWRRHSEPQWRHPLQPASQPSPRWMPTLLRRTARLSSGPSHLWERDSVIGVEDSVILTVYKCCLFPAKKYPLIWPTYAEFLKRILNIPFFSPLNWAMRSQSDTWSLNKRQASLFHSLLPWIVMLSRQHFTPAGLEVIIGDHIRRLLSVAQYGIM